MTQTTHNAHDMPTAFQKEPVNFLLSNALRHLTQDQQRQLCNALLERLSPANAQKEAEALYPGPDNKFSELDYAYLLNRQLIRRAAHIACASRYQSEIQRMGELLMEKDGEIEGLKNEVQKLKNLVEDAYIQGRNDQIRGGSWKNFKTENNIL